MTVVLIVLALAGGVAAGAALHRRFICAPSCRGGVYLWTPEQERAAWERGVTNGVAYARGELGGRGRADIAAVLASQAARMDEDEDEASPWLAA